MIRAKLLSAILFVAAASSGAVAQDPNSPRWDLRVKPADTVRLWERRTSAFHSGVVTRVTEGTVVINERSAKSLESTFMVATTLRLDVLDGRRTTKTRDAFIGLAVGAVVGAFVGAEIGRRSCDFECQNGIGRGVGEGIAGMYGVITFGFVGTVTGALVGTRESPNWRRVYP